MRYISALVLLICVSLVAGTQEKRYVLPTLQWLTHSSDVVVIAKTARVDGTTVHLQVLSLLKGHTGPDVEVHVNSGEPPAIGQVAVCFLRTPAGGSGDFEQVDRDRMVELDAEKLPHPVLDIDLNPIETQTALVSKIRAAVEQVPQRADSSIQLEVPSFISVRIGLMRGDTEVIFPATSDMEHTAKQWVLPTAGSWPEFRKLAVTVLAHFNSPKNVGILRELVAGGKEVAGDAAGVLETWAVPTIDPNAKRWPALDVKKATSPRLIRVSINGKEVSFKGVSPPRIIGASVYARACTLSKAMNVHMYTYTLKVGQGVWVDDAPLEIYMPATSHTIWVGDGVEPVDNPSYMIKGEGFFPVRYVAEKLGATVRWDPRRSMVVIQTQKPTP